MESTERHMITASSYPEAARKLSRGHRVIRIDLTSGGEPSEWVVDDNHGRGYQYMEAVAALDRMKKDIRASYEVVPLVGGKEADGDDDEPDNAPADRPAPEGFREFYENEWEEDRKEEPGSPAERDRELLCGAVEVAEFLHIALSTAQELMSKTFRPAFMGKRGTRNIYDAARVKILYDRYVSDCRERMRDRARHARELYSAQRRAAREATETAAKPEEAKTAVKPEESGSDNYPEKARPAGSFNFIVTVPENSANVSIFTKLMATLKAAVAVARTEAAEQGFAPGITLEAYNSVTVETDLQ